EDPLLHALGKLPRDAHRTPGAWVEVFLDVLDAFGWPGDHTLSSREFQARERFQELLREFGDLDAVLGPIPLAEALRRFRLLAGERVFQVQSTGAPVQIMGVRESTGLRFTHCRVLGMNDELWPPRPHSTAFLPVALQRRAGLPAADPELYLVQMRGQTTALMRLAEEVTFTCSATDGDRELLPSLLLDDFATEEKDAVRDDVIHLLAGSDSQVLQSREETYATPVRTQTEVRGGAGIITAQSACPFRAFALYRLHADRSEDIVHGLRALDRGNLVHKALDRLWEQLGSSAALMALNDAQRLEHIADAVSLAFEDERAVKGRRISGHILEAERACLILLLDEWLHKEMQRPPFEVVGREVPTEVEIAGLHLSVRIDRIDSLEGGARMLIDYKTGKKTAAAWLPPRPEEAQLPMYLRAMGSDVRALAYAVLRRGKCGYCGVRGEDMDFDALQTAGEYLAKHGYEEADWTMLREEWEEVLKVLAEEFQSGYAVVRPRDGERTCRWCPLPSLCRINDAGFGVEEDDGDRDDFSDRSRFGGRTGKEDRHGQA
ncbi:MAG: PD-(D/E)XK nuclease family protein, partial [Bacteroidetes bacterium]|nr:PD-(D/E)XK nuclease family protein [Bacteroidota bacterium]